MALAYFPCNLLQVAATHDHRNLWSEGYGPFYVGTHDHTGSEVHYTLRLEFTTDKYALDYYTVRIRLVTTEGEYIDRSSEFRYAICSASNDDLYVHAHGDVSDSAQVGSGKVTVSNVERIPPILTGGEYADAFNVICSSAEKLLPNTTYYVYLWDLEYLQVTDVIPGDSGSSDNGEGNGTIITEMLPGWVTIEGLRIDAQGSGYIYRHTVEIGSEAGFVSVEDTRGFKDHQVFIDDGDKYDQYIAYIDTGTDWDMFS